MNAPDELPEDLAPVHPMDAHRPAHLYPLAAEKACVGIVLLRGVKAMDTIRALLRPEDFDHPQCRAAFAALVELDEEGRLPASNAVPLVQVMNEIAANGDGGKFPGGQEQIHGLFLHDAPAFGGEEGAEIAARLVVGASRRRLAVERADSAKRTLLTDPALARDSASREFLDQVAEDFAELASRTVTDEPAMHVSVVMDEHDQLMRDRLEGTASIVRSGIGGLDRLIEGFDSDAGEFVVLAGRPSMGKTATAQAIERGQYVEERHPGEMPSLNAGPWSDRWKPIDSLTPVFWASAEMSPTQLIDRRAADLTSVNSRQIQRPVRSRATRDDDLRRWQQVAPYVAEAKRMVRGCPVYYATRPKIIDEIERQAKAWRRAHPTIGKYANGDDRKGPAVLIADHLGELQLIGGPRRGESKSEYMNRKARRLRDLGKSLHCVVILLAQLNRSVESRDDKRPMMSDLRQAGELEEMADTVLFCYRHPYYGLGQNAEGVLWSQYWELRKNGASVDQLRSVLARATAMEIIARKARNGAVGTAAVSYVRMYTRVCDRIAPGSVHPGRG